jgi:hypothetical protein
VEDSIEKSRSALKLAPNLAPVHCQLGPPLWVPGSAAPGTQALLPFNLKVIRKGEERGGSLCVHPGFIHLHGHHTLEGNVPVLHNNMNRRNGVAAVINEARVVVDGPSDGDPQAIVKLRGGEDFKIVG